MSKKSVIEIRGLSKRYSIGSENAGGWSFKDLLGLNGSKTSNSAKVDAADEIVWALKDISLDIYQGERIGIIGRNGAGKSTLLKILSRVIYPTEGEAIIRGRVTSLLEVGTGFNNNATGRQNIYLNASLHGLRRAEIDERVEDIIDFAEIRRFIDTPIKHYSSGMRARLAFSVAAHLDPDILMLDEVLSVGDMAFQQKCLVRMKEVTEQGRTLLFVSHSIGSINQFCDRCVWIHDGGVVMDDDAETVTAKYSSELLGSVSQVKFAPPSRPTNKRQKMVLEENEGSPEKWAFMHSASVTNQADENKTIFSSNDEIFLHIDYEISFDKEVYPAFRVYQDQALLFTMVYWKTGVPDKVGRYQAQAVIPKAFLNPGDFTVSVGLNTPATGGLIRHQVEEKALSFSVHDLGGAISPRGPYTNVKGAVRPFFDWQVKQLADTTDRGKIEPLPKGSDPSTTPTKSSPVAPHALKKLVKSK